MLIAPISGAIAISAALISSQPWAEPASRFILRGFEFAWIFPLVQIAFLSYPQKDRFAIQAYAFLVIAPLLEWGTEWLKLGTPAAPLASFAILGFMTLCVVILAKNNKSLTVRNQ